MNLLAYYPIYIFDHDVQFIPNVFKPETFSPLKTQREGNYDFKNPLENIPIYPHLENSNIYLSTFPILENNQTPYFSKSLYFLVNCLNTLETEKRSKQTFHLFEMEIFDNNFEMKFLLNCKLIYSFMIPQDIEIYNIFLTIDCELYELLNYTFTHSMGFSYIYNFDEFYKNSFFNNIEANKMSYNQSFLFNVINN